MIAKIKSVKDIVLSMLTKFPETRDNDRLLLVYVWATQNPEMKRHEHSFREFGIDFIKGQYADPESIRRSRQKIQELYPDLRGKNYNIKINKLEPEMRYEMNNT